MRWLVIASITPFVLAGIAFYGSNVTASLVTMIAYLMGMFQLVRIGMGDDGE